MIAWAALPRGDPGGEEEPQPLLDFRPVLANRDVLALIVGYAAAIWGCVGLRQWIVVFLTFCAGNQAVEEMGEALVRASFSTNIKERRDCSTALFDRHGATLCQAEHIPMPSWMREAD